MTSSSSPATRCRPLSYRHRRRAAIDVHDRGARHAPSRQRLVPPLLVGRRVRSCRRVWETFPRLVGAVRSEGAIVSGSPASPGRATGLVRVIRGPSEFDDLQPGEILVAPLTAPRGRPCSTEPRPWSPTSAAPRPTRRSWPASTASRRSSVAAMRPRDSGRACVSAWMARPATWSPRTSRAPRAPSQASGPTMAPEMAAKRTGNRPHSADSSEPHPTSDREPDDGRLAAAEVAAERMAAATRRVAGRAVDAAGAVVEAADGVVESIRPAAEHLAASTRDAAVEGARHLPRSSRRRSVPLPNLYEVHPEARDAPLRELGSCRSRSTRSSAPRSWGRPNVAWTSSRCHRSARRTGRRAGSGSAGRHRRCGRCHRSTSCARTTATG